MKKTTETSGAKRIKTNKPLWREDARTDRMPNVRSGMAQDWNEMDSKIDNDPQLSTSPPYVKFRLRYMSPFRRIDAEGEWFEKQIQCENVLDQLEMQAKQGFINGLRELAWFATEATRRLNRWAVESPEYVAYVAEGQPGWPILITKTSVRDKELQDFLRMIKLDSARTLVAAGSKVGLEPEGTKKWALKLLIGLENARRIGGGQSLHSACWGFTKFDCEGLLEILSLPEKATILAKAKELPPLTGESLPLWCKQAKSLFLSLTKNKPWNIKELASCGKSARATPRIAGAKVDGKMRSDITKAVMSAFSTLAKSTWSDG